MRQAALLLAALALLPGASVALLPPEEPQASVAAAATGPNARGVVLELLGRAPRVLVEATAAMAAGEGSSDRAAAAQVRAGTHTADAAWAEASASPGSARAVAEAAFVELLGGAVRLEAARVRVASANGQASGFFEVGEVKVQGAVLSRSFPTQTTIPLVVGALTLNEQVAVPGGLRVCAARLVLGTGESAAVLCATAATPAPSPAPLPPMPSRASASATTLEVPGGHRAADDASASAGGAASGTARGVQARADATSTGANGQAAARVEVPSVVLLNGLVEARDLLAVAEASSDDTDAVPQGLVRVGHLLIDGHFFVSPVPPNWSLELPGVGMLHANELRFEEVEDPDTSTTYAAVEAVALRLVLLDGGEGPGRETSVARARAEAFAPRTPRVELALREFDDPVRAGDAVTFEYTARSSGTATLVEGEVVDDALGAFCTFRLLRPDEAIPCTRVEVVEADLPHVGTASSRDAWGSPAEASAQGHIEVIDA